MFSFLDQPSRDASKRHPDTEQGHELSDEFGMARPSCTSNQVAVSKTTVDRVGFKPRCPGKYHIQLDSRVCSAFPTLQNFHSPRTASLKEKE